MKKLKVFLVLLGLIFCTAPTGAQISTIHDFNALLAKSERDSIAKIERLAALEFHQIINDYRISKGIKPIEWNEVLWIASRNHCIWMKKAKNLSHEQKPNTALFTGHSPGERYNYAAGGESTFSWSGENALYNYSAIGSTIEEIAKEIARSSFSQWKNSPGHNKNMLGQSHGMHGAAFIIGENKVWGTDLFASCRECPTPKEELAFYSNKKSTSPKTEPTPEPEKTASTTTAKTQTLVVSKAQKEVKSGVVDGLEKMYSQTLTLSSRLENQAYDHARELLNRKIQSSGTDGVLLTELSDSDKNPIRILMGRQKSIFNIVIEKNTADFNAAAISSKLTDLITHNVPLQKKKKMGIAIALRKKKNSLRIAMSGIFS
jgi:hypothetical protein